MDEIVFEDRNTALEVAKFLLKENYVVMLSNEEELTILSFEYSEYGNRNGVVFMSKEEFEERFEERLEDEDD